MSVVPRNSFQMVSRSTARQRVFALTHAGGSVNTIRRWASRTPADVDLWGLELPGRGYRFSEPLRSEVSEIVEEMIAEISPLLDRPYVVFGHSLGARLALELTRGIHRRRAPAPARLYVAAAVAPHVTEDVIHHAMADDDLKAHLLELSGTRPEVLADPELMKIFIPILRSDFTMYECHDFTRGEPVGCPITALWGTRDATVPRASMTAWSRYTRGSFDLREVDGDHFFPTSLPEAFWTAFDLDGATR